MDPLNYTSLGSLNITSGDFTFSAPSAMQSQSGGYPDIAVFVYDDIFIGAGVNVSVGSSHPVAILSRGDLTIQSTLTFNGSAGSNGTSFATSCDTSTASGGAGAFGGFGGGAGGAMDTTCSGPVAINASATAGSPGGGPGGGGGGGLNQPGAGGQLSATGPQSPSLGLIGGSGGGGGGGDDTGIDARGGGGGGGGAAIEFGAVGTVSLSGVTVNGGAGGLAAPGRNNAGGSGSGGMVFAHGSSVSISELSAVSGDGSLTGAVRLAPNTFAIGDALPTVDAGLAELAPDLTEIPTGQTLTLAANGIAMPGGLTLYTKDIAVDDGGTLSGDGTVSGSLTNAGIVSPGNSPGHMDVIGDYVQEATGILEIQIGGTSRTTPVEYDSLDAQDVTLDGTLVVELIDLLSGGSIFSPSAGDFFDIIYANAITGDFTSFLFPTLAGLHFEREILSLGAGQFAYRLTVAGNAVGGNEVPEPATFIIFAVGLAGLGWSYRRQFAPNRR